MIQSQQQGARPHRSWWRVLLIGLLLYIIGIVILVLTGNPNLFPTVVLLGNFLVPVAYVVFFYERRYLSELTLPTTALTFFYGGVLGVFAASLLEPIFIRRLDIVKHLLEAAGIDQLIDAGARRDAKMVLAIGTYVQRILHHLAKQHPPALGAAHPEALGNSLGLALNRIFAGKLGHRGR